MNKDYNFKCFLFFSIIIAGNFAFAQRITVQKIRDNQAVVEASGVKLKAGRSYDILPNDGDTPSWSERSYALGATLSFENSKSDAVGASTETNISLEGKWGWNFEILELGPIASFTSNQDSLLSPKEFKIGAFADYNLIPNVAGETFIYGVGGNAQLGRFESLATKNDLIEFCAGPFAKWFPGGGPVGFRMEVTYKYQKASPSSGLSSTTTTGFRGQLGVTAYF